MPSERGVLVRDLREKEAPKPVKGVVGVIERWTREGLLVVQEGNEKPQYDKQVGDLGLVMGTREEGENPLETLFREFEEETGFRRELLSVNPLPVGSLPTTQGAVLVYRGLVHVDGVPLQPRQDDTTGETILPGFVSPRFLDCVGVRGGVWQIVKQVYAGCTGFEVPCVGFHADGNGRVTLNTIFVARPDGTVKGLHTVRRNLEAGDGTK